MNTATMVGKRESLVSECCFAPVESSSERGEFYAEHGVCTDCKNHCSFVPEDDGGYYVAYLRYNHRPEFKPTHEDVLGLVGCVVGFLAIIGLAALLGQ